VGIICGFGSSTALAGIYINKRRYLHLLCQRRHGPSVFDSAPVPSMLYGVWCSRKGIVSANCSPVMFVFCFRAAISSAFSACAVNKRGRYFVFALPGPPPRASGMRDGACIRDGGALMQLVPRCEVRLKQAGSSRPLCIDSPTSLTWPMASVEEALFLTHHPRPNPPPLLPPHSFAISPAQISAYHSAWTLEAHLLGTRRSK
jgi:hypothetical protein